MMTSSVAIRMGNQFHQSVSFVTFLRKYSKRRKQRFRFWIFEEFSFGDFRIPKTVKLFRGNQYYFQKRNFFNKKYSYLDQCAIFLSISKLGNCKFPLWTFGIDRIRKRQNRIHFSVSIFGKSFEIFSFFEFFPFLGYLVQLKAFHSHCEVLRSYWSGKLPQTFPRKEKKK